MNGPVIHKGQLFGWKLLKTFHWYSGDEREISWTSQNLAAEGINTDVTAKYCVRNHLYSTVLQGLLLFACGLEQSSSDTAREKVHLCHSLNVKNIYPAPHFQSLELLLAIAPWGEPLLTHGVFLDVGLVGEAPWWSGMQGMLHSPGMTENFNMSRVVTGIICCANQQGQGCFFAEKSQGTFSASCWEECMCVRPWMCHLSAVY